MNLYLPQATVRRRFARKGQWRRSRSVTWTTRHCRPTGENSQDDLRSKILHYCSFSMWKHRYLVTGIVCLFLFVGVIVTLQMQKIYSATTTIKIDQSVPQVFKTQSDADGARSEDTLETQLELIRSRAVAERVATALELGQSDFISGPKPSLFKRLFGGGSSADPPPMTLNWLKPDGKCPWVR